MLNLDENNLIIFSDLSQNYLATLIPYNQAYWDLTTARMKTVKREIKEQLIAIQDNKCAYCTKNLDDRVPNADHMQLEGDREHIAPKSIYPQFLFTELNLVLACDVCNRTLKNDADTILTYNAVYRNSVFNIVHPYIDDYTLHIEFDTPMIICLRHLSQKGFNTIDMFKLDGQYATKIRSERYSDSIRPALEQEIEDLKQEILFYKTVI